MTSETTVSGVAFGDEIECESDKSYDSLRVTLNISPVTPTNYGGTVLKESDDLDVLGDIIF